MAKAEKGNRDTAIELPKRHLETGYVARAFGTVCYYSFGT